MNFKWPSGKQESKSPALSKTEAEIVKPYLDIVEDLVKEAKEVHALRIKENRRVSDIVTVDGDTEIEWVDLVLQGGGMLGVGIAGYCYVLEQVGIRFRGLCGTSAGAINALLIAAVRNNPREPSSQKLVSILAETDFSSFMDYDPAKAVLMAADKLHIMDNPTPAEKGQFFRLMVLKMPLIVEETWRNRGMHSGKAFTDWITKTLVKYGVSNLADLNKHLQFSDGLEVTDLHTGKTGSMPLPAGAEPGRGLLKLITSDISTQTKVLFPEDADMYWEDPLAVNPGLFARASMSIPLFFQPMEVHGVPHHKEKWVKKGYTGRIPEKVTFVDGGTLSNFPVKEFHHVGVPKLPTLAVQLGWDRHDVQPTDNFVQFYAAANNASRHMLDHEFQHENPEYKMLTGTVDAAGDADQDGVTDEGRESFNWLDFSMPADKRVRLFRRGAEAALEFYKRFDWNAYKALRQQQAAATMREMAIAFGTDAITAA